MGVLIRWLCTKFVILRLLGSSVKSAFALEVGGPFDELTVNY